jgi:hypothetical protein
MRVASVPEFVKRKRSIAGKRAFTSIYSVLDRLSDPGVRVPVEAGRVFAEKVDVAVAVGIVEQGSVGVVYG